MFFFYDRTFWLVLLGIALCAIASANVSRTYRIYSKMRNAGGHSAARIAQLILEYAGVYDVGVEETNGNLTDHYDPRTKTVYLSEAVYASDSVAAIGVAAHECGHANQDHEGYLALRLRSVLVPVANFGSFLSWPLILIGILLGSMNLVHFGILLFSAILVFQMVTLPVEFNASVRALHFLKENAILIGEEITGARKVLNAAAMTYVTATLATALQLLRMFLLFGRRRSD